jgi:DNA repair exonuclease SbcCD ATPase subunit
MQTRDKEKQSEEGEGEEKRDLELENVIGNLLVAEYQVYRLRTRLNDLINGYRPRIKHFNTYSNALTNGMNHHLEKMKLILTILKRAGLGKQLVHKTF